MGDQTARDAIARSITARLLLCDEVELRALDRMLTAIEKRRDLFDILESLKRTEPRLPRSREAEVVAGLRELRDAMTYKPRPPLRVLRGGLADAAPTGEGSRE